MKWMAKAPSLPAVDILKAVKTVFTDKSIKPLFEALAAMEVPIPTINVRVGDVGFTSAEEKYQSLFIPTTIAAFLAYLKNSNTGSEEPTPRFTPQRGNHCYGGYYIDDWFRVFVANACFFRRREFSNVLGLGGP